MINPNVFVLLLFAILFGNALIRYIHYRKAPICDGFVVKIEQKQSYNPKRHRTEMMNCYTFEYEFDGMKYQDESMEGDFHLGDHAQLHLDRQGKIMEKNKVMAQMVSFGLLTALCTISLIVNSL